MAEINLLPWREERRERKNKEFRLILLLSVLLACLLAFAVWTYFTNELNEQFAANDYVAEQNLILDKQLKEIDVLEQRRGEIIARTGVIQDLQGRRPVPVRVWYDVARAIPEAMYINVFEREDNILSFTGKADNPNVVSSLVRNLDASDWLDNSRVKFIKQDVAAYESGVPKNLNQDDETVLPESNFIDFVVTSQIVEFKNGETFEPETDSEKVGE